MNEGRSYECALTGHEALDPVPWRPRASAHCLDVLDRDIGADGAGGGEEVAATCSGSVDAALDFAADVVGGAVGEDVADGEAPEQDQLVAGSGLHLRQLLKWHDLVRGEPPVFL